MRRFCLNHCSSCSVALTPSPRFTALCLTELCDSHTDSACVQVPMLLWPLWPLPRPPHFLVLQLHPLGLSLLDRLLPLRVHPLPPPQLHPLVPPILQVDWTCPRMLQHL